MRNEITNEYNYTTKLDIKFKNFEVIDIQKMVGEVKDKWFNQTLTEVNGSVVRVGIVEGEYHLPCLTATAGRLAQAPE